MAFGAWSAVADILFVPVIDGGGPFNVEPIADIRIGAHVFDGPSGTLAHAFFPPPNGVTAAGDTHFDSAEPWTCAPSAGSIGFGIVAVHEVGHAIGLGHELTEIAVMNPFYNAALTFGPLADDLIGAGEIYGEAGAAATSFFGPVRIGTASPDSPASLLSLVRGGSGNAGLPRITFDNTDGTVDWFVDSDDLDRFRISVNGSGVQEFRLSSSGDLMVTGTIVSGGGGTCDPGPCDGVFKPTFTVPSIEEHAEFMWTNSHLWGVGPTKEGTPFNLTRKTAGVLHELEVAHIYIERLHERLRQEKARNDELEKRLARVESLLGVDRAAD